jgi:hypothetical protein
LIHNLPHGASKSFLKAPKHPLNPSKTPFVDRIGKLEEESQEIDEQKVKKTLLGVENSIDTEKTREKRRFMGATL